VTQPFGPGWLILMLLAATAPMLFAGPAAVMHWPTFSAAGPTVTTLRYLLAAVVVTVMVVVPAPAAKLLACTTKPLADSAVTLPLAPPNAPPPNAPLLPLGRALGLKLGRGEAVPRGPPNPPAPPQLPLTGLLMVTLAAVTDLVPAPVDAGTPTTVTQLPTVTSFAVAATVSVIAVVAVKVTVTCPVVGFCTSRLDPDTAAAVPTTPGKAAAVLVGAGLLLGTAGAAVVPAPLAHAVAASTTIPRPARAGAKRRPRLRLAADVRLVVAPVMANSHPRGGLLAAQRVDRGEPGGAGGGIDAEADANADRDDDRADGGGR
jgi:hypothetical protein